MHFPKLSNQKWPSLGQWKQLFKILNKKEKKWFLVFFVLFLFSSLFLATNSYYKNTEIVPKNGGTYIEGIVGQPRYINPIYATSNDVDRDLTELLFSGLMKYNNKGEIIPDFAKDYKSEDEGRTYIFYLKENIVWSDGEKFSADDIVFTIKTIQNSDYKSDLRTNWLGVEVEKISDNAIKFKLNKPYSGFLERLTLKILPAHIWQDISPENFSQTYYNLHPISCGPYELKKLDQKEIDPYKKLSIVKSLTLERDPDYFDNKPYISKIIFYFFENEEALIKAAKQNKIKGFSLASFENKNLFEGSFSEYNFVLPRYFAVFFNPNESDILDDKDIRKALNYGTNKQEIIEKALLGQGQVISSPILSEIFNYELPAEIYEYDLEKAKEILDKNSFKETESGLREKTVKKELAFTFKSRLTTGSKGKEVEELQKCLADPDIVGPEIYPEGKITGYFGSKTKAAVIRFQEKYKEEILDPWGYAKGTGTVGKTTRDKLNELCFGDPYKNIQLKFSLSIVENPVFKKVAELLKEQWREIGVELEIQSHSISDIQNNFIKPRKYDSLLFGEVLAIIPDPYPFWHSLQKIHPGLNLAMYENKKTDKLLEDARQTQDFELRKEKLEKFQEILISDAPCVFLYSPNYLYFISKEIKGVEQGIIAEPSKRFNEVENWYIKTKKTWK
ncbi:peptidoglycan-binding protein [Candidatus Parcubacteria bacterium]|nr:peptidoglycan-binding protein [Candidatus Parcubacteria bacterium]